MSCIRWNLAIATLVLLQNQSVLPVYGAEKKAAAKQQTISFEEKIKPILTEYCSDCHFDGAKKGGVDFDKYKSNDELFADKQLWSHVLQNVRTHVMPPPKDPQPTQEERDLIAQWVDKEIFKVDCDNPDPGRVTIRRLNRVEYNNTIRDLVGIDFQPAADFPADDSGYGFDNIGDVLSMPPVLLERYMAAADKILSSAIVSGPSTNGPVKRFEAEKLPTTADGGPYGDWAMALMREGEIHTNFNFPKDGEYIIRARAFAQQAGDEPAKMEFRLDGSKVHISEVKAIEKIPQVYEHRLQLTAGERKLSAAYINNYRNPQAANPDNSDRNLYIDYVEVVGPIGPARLPETHTRIFVRQPTPETKTESAREIISRFAKRAFRRPVTDSEVDRLMRLFELATKQGDDFENSVKLALKAVLVSPHFLFRGEIQPEPNNPKSVHQINEYALASRLSYFLWSSMPDDELFALAEKGGLRKNLPQQVKRMLKDARAQALVDNFAGQWLQTRNLKLSTPDWEEFPEFDMALRTSMARETELFFAYIMKEDRSVLDFLNADYTFVNGRLARHYGIPDVAGDAFQKVSLKGHNRAGVLTHGSILTITSNPTRTSPVKRGKWVLENILGSPPPPPPPDVPELEEEKGHALTGSLRQRLEQHREKPMCASCHARMDPLGFGLENFNAVGGWRKVDGTFPVEPSGKLVSGEEFNGPTELAKILADSKKDEFIRCLTEKLLTYALGRGVEYYDKCAVEQVSKGLAQNEYRFSALISEIVQSVPFQMRRGEEEPATTAKVDTEAK